MLSIQLLGSPQLQLNGNVLSVPRRKSRALLYYLAAHPAPVTRDHVLALLWPDHDRSAAQQILRTSLHGLRKLLGAALLTTDDTLALTPDIEVDVRTFETQLTAPQASTATLSSTLALYHGDFLADFNLPDSETFDAWASSEREHYRTIAIRGLTALAHQYELQQDYANALDTLARALNFDPLQEDVQRAAMRLHYLAGDRAGAIRRYEQLRRLLDDELGVPPMDETRALYDAIITDSLPRDTTSDPVVPTPLKPAPPARIAPNPPNVLPFIGRTSELQKLHEVVLTHKLALIEGEPGIGKTRLAEEFLCEFDGIALVGAARELEHALPYQPIIEALRGLLVQPTWSTLRHEIQVPSIWLAETARLLPELAHDINETKHVSEPAHSASESRLWEGMNQFLLALARHRPLVLLLDDLHWGDASTLALLGYLVRQSISAPIMFLATARIATPRSPLAALLQTLTREDRLLRLPLKRLSSAETVALARQLSPNYVYPLSDWLVHNTEGNPYFVAELVRYARERDILQANGTLNLSALSSSPVVPHGVYSLIESRLNRLSPAARHVLDIAVAVGREFELDLVARAAGLDEATILDALDELRTNGLITPIADVRYAFDHSLTMEVAYREIGGARHRVAHRQVAEALEALNVDNLDAVAGLIASHFAEGNVPERAAHYAFRAGQRAAELAAWTEAIAFYEMALAGSQNGQRETLYLALGAAYFQSGMAARASDAYRAELNLAQNRKDMPAVNRARLLLGRTLLAQARFGEAIALAQSVLDSDAIDNTIEAELLWGSVLSVEGVDLDGAMDHLNKAANGCILSPDPAILAQSTFERGSVAAQQGDLTHAIKLYREALQIGETYPTAVHYRILAQNNLAYHLLLQGDPSAIEHARAGLRLSQEIGVLQFQPYLLSTLGEIELNNNDLDAAERTFEQGLELAERLPVPERIAGITANLGLISLRRGQTALAIHRLSTALARADALGTRHLAAQIRIWLAPLLPPAEARSTLAEARAIAESGGRQRLLNEITQLEAKL